MISFLNTAILKFFRHFGYDVVRLRDNTDIKPINVFPLIVQDYIKRKTKDEFFFVQIGANDGIRHDPLRPLIADNWKGVLVEPNPTEFRVLKENYKDKPNYSFEMAAITDFDGKIKMFCSNGSEYESVFASIHKRSATIAQQKPESVHNSKLVEIECNAMTLDTLFAQHQIKDIDLLQVDTEGHDYFIILQLLQKTKMRPAIIQFEHSHMSKEQEADSFALLSKAGYEVLPVGFDTVALKK